VKTVRFEVAPGNGPVGELHVEADPDGPDRTHVIVPAGAVAPEIPVTVAVYVIVPPRTGLEGDVVTAIDGVAGATVSESGVYATAA